MNFTLTEEQLLLQESARQFFAQHGTSAAMRQAMAAESGYDAAVWRSLVEMGWTGITVPESEGGLGLGQVELVIALQEMGRCLYASPFLPSICLALPALLTGSESQRARWLPALLAGDSCAALACTGARGLPGPDGLDAQLTQTGSGEWTLSGCAGFAIFGHAADLFVVAVRAPGSRGDQGISLVALPRASRGLGIEKIVGLDPTRPYAKLTFDAIPVTQDLLLGAPEMAAPALRRTLALGAIALAAEQVGAAEHCLTMTTEYAKQRVQFGRPIGSFQAVKHKLADMMVLVEAAKSALYYAACVADEDPAQLFEAAAVVKSFCGDALQQCAGQAIQLHGGMGFTWEHDAQLYFKRARASSNQLGDALFQREQIAQGLLDGNQPLLRQLGGL